MVSIEDEVASGTTNGIWRRPMYHKLLFGDSESVLVKPDLISDPWAEMMNDEGEMDEELRYIRI